MHGFHATMTAHPGKGDELVELLLAAPSLPHEDCVVFLVTRSASNGDVVSVTEGWTSREAHAAFFATRAAQTLVSRRRPSSTDGGAHRAPHPRRPAAPAHSAGCRDARHRPVRDHLRHR